MSEGELKKRIRELGYGEISKDGSPWIDTKPLFRSDIEKILDEAKQDFPTPPNYKDYFTETKENWEGWRNACNKFDAEVMLWKNEWFGE